MDFIGEIAGKLGIESQQAKALAGGLMGMVQQATRQEQGDQVADELEAAVPELKEWKQEAEGQMGEPAQEADVAGLLGGLLGGGSQAGGSQAGGAQGGGQGGGLGDLLGAAGAMFGGAGGQAAQLAGLISKLGIGADKAQMVAPMALSFLQSRLSPELMQKVLAVAPFLTGGSKPQGEGGSGGLLGGLLG